MLTRGKDFDQFDALANSLTAHPFKSQILIELQSEGNTLETALAVLNERGIRALKYRILQQGDCNYLLLYISNECMREAVLCLTEAGFVRLKGISAKIRGHDYKMG